LISLDNRGTNVELLSIGENEMTIPAELMQLCLGFGLLFAGVICVAMAVKWLEVRRAGKWPVTSGIITRARVRSKQHTDPEGRSRFVNEPYVTYEYIVVDRTYRASRISFAERISGSDVEKSLLRYPVGKTVQVYYDPHDPSRAVLERKLPQGVVLVGSLLAVFLLGFAIIFPLLIYGGAKRLATWMPDPDMALFTLLSGAMGLFSLLIALAIQRQVRASKTWNTCEGRVLSASESTGGLQYQGQQKIIYAYSVKGRQYLGDRIRFGGIFTRSPAWLIPSNPEKYTEDNPVRVYYDPGDPGEAVLECRAAGIWILFLAAGLLFFLALWSGGWI
jgi:hypothetical protein